jgi:type IV secretory pathway VirB3-like protein
MNIQTTGNVENLENMEAALSRGWIAKKREFTILLADIVALFLLLKFLPYEPQTNAGLAMLFFVGVLWLTEAVHVTITALLVPILAVILGLMDVGKALRSFADPTIFLFFGGFALATALHIQGIDRFIANRLLMLARGRLAAAAVMLFLATAALSMWISNTATAAMMLPLSLGILGNLDAEKEHNTFIFLLLGVAYKRQHRRPGHTGRQPAECHRRRIPGAGFHGLDEIRPTGRDRHAAADDRRALPGLPSQPQAPRRRPGQ